MNRNLAMEFVRVTEMAAIASARLMGRGDEKAADQAAVDAMRAMLDSIDCDATVVIGEGERDEARCGLQDPRLRGRWWLPLHHVLRH